MSAAYARRAVVLAVGMAGLFGPADMARAFVVGANGWHLDTPLQLEHNSDLVCKVRVTAVRNVGVAACNLFPGAPDVMRKIATARVLSVLKGDCGATIEIEFDYRQGDSFGGVPACQLFTELRPDECCLVFLKRSENGYRLNRIRSKARVAPALVFHEQDEPPLLGLLAEFLAGLDSDDPKVRLQAVEELGVVGDTLMEELHSFTEPNDPSARIASGLKKARQAIRRARLDENLVVRCVAIMSTFQLGDAPDLDQAKEVLLVDPNRFTSVDSRTEYGIDDFCIVALQKRLLETLDATTRRALKDLDNGSTLRRPTGHGIFRGVPGFPYASFFRFALETEAVARSAETRGCIANVIWIRYERASVPEMVRLLDDPDISIRRTAVSALNKCIRSHFTNAWGRSSFHARSPVGEGAGQTPEKPLEERLKDYEQNEPEYLEYWKDWWQKNRGAFENDVQRGGSSPGSTGNGDYVDLIDTHCHLTFEPLADDVPGVVARSRAEGVTGWITVGTHLEDSRRAIALAAQNENMFATVGIHPHDAKDADDAALDELKRFAQGEKVVAIGETGLDFHYNFSKQADQGRVFAAHLEIAADLGLPIVVHSRNAFDETMEILDRYDAGLKGVVFHCFSGTADQARLILDKGYYASFTGVVTFKNAETARAAAGVVPLDRMMVETDCPYMSPEPLRKQKPNEPALMVHTARLLAEIKGVELDEFARQTTRTAEACFGLG